MLLHRTGRPGVVDWELAEPSGLVASDLFFFLTYVAFARHRAARNDTYVPAFHAAFFGKRAWARPYVQAYAERLSLNQGMLGPLLAVTWLRYLAGLLVRLGSNGDSPAPVGRETIAWLRANRELVSGRRASSVCRERTIDL